MTVSSLLSEHLRSNLSTVLKDSGARRELDDLVRVCHSLALSALRGKIASGKLSADFFGLNDSDLAYDCIADLLQRDEGGKLLLLSTYFEAYSLEDASDELVLSYLRRLVFSRVNQSLFRFYHEIDPALAKILRNTKLAVQALGTFQEADRFGETYLEPGFCDPLYECRELDEEELRQFLADGYRAADRIPHLLSKLGRALRQQDQRCRAVRLMAFAFALRDLMSRSTGEAIVHPVAEETLLVEDARSIIREVCSEMKRKNRERYVGKKKVSGSEYDDYFVVIERKLTERFVGEDGDGISLFEELKKEISTLTKEGYRSRHKNILEYLSRLAYDKAVEKLRKG
ncbi:MAG TPA: hypothetical protein VMG34_09900 [Bacteroidota bacterium]|nr:hypothetical protein [Bacteroidota bacterium]